MQMPAIPAFSYSWTVRITLRALPNPVSQSAMTGMPTASTMFFVTSSCSVIVRKLPSGMHLSDAEMPKPEAQIASNPASSISLALSASWAPTVLMIPGRRINSRSLAACVMGPYSG